jgi:hypothetical protein
MFNRPFFIQIDRSSNSTMAQGNAFLFFLFKVNILLSKTELLVCLNR